MNYISGEKFVELSTFIYHKNVGKYDDYYHYAHTFDLQKINESTDTPIIYTTTYLVEFLLSDLKECKKEIILITHNADLCVDESLFIKKPDCVIRWFSQNVDYVNSILNSLPIGLENSIWFVDLNKLNKIGEKVSEEKKIKNLVYMNHNISTNPNERQKPYNLLHEKSWVTTDMRANGQLFNEYLDNIYNHKFVICPRGNGIDTHRTWECLYVNTIPIEKRNINNQFYSDLPICFVDDWEEITEDFLEKEYLRINDIKWNLNKLDFDYWKNKITNHAI